MVKDNSPEAKAARKAARKAAKQLAKTKALDAATQAAKKAKKAAKKAKKAAKLEKKRKAQGSASSPAKKSKTDTSVSSDEITAFREKNNMIISGRDADITPFLTFDAARKHFPKECMAALDAQGYVAPTPIQAQTWPALLNRRDMIGVAETGSGKTMAFVLPAAAIMLKGDCSTKGRFPRFLCLSPTRELAMQIDQVCQDVGKCCGLKAHCIYGGVPKWSQRAALKSGIDFCIGTPGRMKDMLENDILDLSRVRFLFSHTMFRYRLLLY